ncbi:hypothetical protein RRG08_004399 [Elysia crispata]|uniref:SMB domain-containing protein n=1 Tax=Elysia crispata TaxID=231223 RepID=A0AAE1EB73_9GAST|nr:hypothetical protein RRG08_004399 [Elysia crispata]
METGYLQDAKCLQNGLKDVIGGQVTDGTVQIADKTPLTGQNMRALKQGVKSDHTGREDPRASKVASSSHSVKDGLLENDLSFTCRGRCGLKISFPCGCSASCVVYQRCCKDMAVDCPHVAQEGRPMLQRFLNVDLFCDDDHVFKINSCPQGTEKDLEQNGNDSKDEDKNVHQLTDLQPSSVWPEVSRTVLEPSSTQKPAATFPGVEDQANSTAVQRFNEALLWSAPRTDLTTGFTFINRTI